MDNSQISFDWQYEFLPQHGKIFRPYIPVKLKTVAGWKLFDFIVDTGADLTMLPYSMIEILDIDINKAQEDEATGIGGYRVKTWQAKIPIMIGTWQMKVPAAFTSDNLTPLLLGRLDTLDRKFSWIFDHKRKKVVFRK